MKKTLALILSSFFITTSFVQVFADTLHQDKLTAISELNEIFKLYDDWDYNDTNWAQLQTTYTDSIQAINNASTKEQVFSLLNTAAHDMINIHRKSETVKICLSVDQFTLQKGFIVMPEVITTREYTPVSQVLVDFFEEKYENKVANTLKYNGDVDNNFELTGIYLENDAVYNPEAEIDVPNYLIQYVGSTIPEKTTTGFLKNGEYTTDSCFLYSVNNKFPNVKASAIPVKDEDVLRWQFSIYGKGADLGANTYYSEASISTFADKSELFWAIAKLHQSHDMKLLLSDENNLELYTKALVAAEISNVSKTAVERAIDKLESIKPVTVPPQDSTEDKENNTENIPEQMPEIAFTDVDDNHYAKDAIVYLAQKGYIKGMPDGTFGVTKTLTRAELATILARIAEYNVHESVPFEDVHKDDWFAQGVAFCFKNNITNGQTPTIFNPHAPITRQELATMLYRYINYTNKTFERTEKTDFADHNSIADYAKEAVYSLYHSGIINGYDGNMFVPERNATRAETAMLLYKIVK